MINLKGGLTFPHWTRLESFKNFWYSSLSMIMIMTLRASRMPNPTANTPPMMETITTQSGIG